MPFDPTYSFVDTEGCDLHYWYQGSGPLLIFVPGGGGIGKQFNSLFEHLDQHFKVCAYDRRQSGLSTVQQRRLLNPAQHARDIIAIVKALGRQRTSIFSNSGGGIIAFQFAISYPEFLDHVAAHETPTTSLLKDSTDYLDKAMTLVDMFHNEGVMAASQAFFADMKGYEDSPPMPAPNLEDIQNFWENEYLPFMTYCPDLRKIVENKVSIAVATGRKSGDAYYSVATIHQEKILRCPRFVFPGNHSSFDAEPATFAPHLLDAFQKMEQKTPRLGWTQSTNADRFQEIRAVTLQVIIPTIILYNFPKLWSYFNLGQIIPVK
jgi:pimeloyl-ACP methyl ester carboxylesterase